MSVTYYPINEDAARRAKEVNSFSDYVPGSAAEEYRKSVDKAVAIAEDQKKRVDPMYHERIDYLLDLYARKLAENMNSSFAIESRVPSVMIAGPANFPVRKKEKQNAARDKNIAEWQAVQNLLDKIRSTGMGGISADDSDAIPKLEQKLAERVELQEHMKAVNAYYRKHKTLEGCKTSCLYFAAAIYRRLYAVNIRAYNGRYTNHEEPADETAPVIDVGEYIVHHPPEHREHGFAVRPWHYQLAKLLDFWLYQTLEDATRNAPLRLAMAEFRDALYGFIIQNSPRYIEIPWGELPQTDYSRYTTEELEKMDLEAFAEYYKAATRPCADGRNFDQSEEAKELTRLTQRYEDICAELEKRRGIPTC